MAAVKKRQDMLTKPRGSLGRLEDLVTQLAGIQRTTTPTWQPAAAAVFAGDHGVVKEGVSAYPAEVTAQMIANFLNEGAAVSVLSR
ncbi:MAG TPA: nicotinate-nucleotide--dimethylbenzimidazole phosphoribosyltransferase, partial [Firmicutes bacterium]|nr:nicotinate-nucleotide--dimethylbenzimidazole phosphoribosyltransferase [Bacillota bacterium]